ncbi:unnamed protein product [Rotaria sp. Silwood2]|nr:unnamed protein product [Rotaria sp. Silwood2]
MYSFYCRISTRKLWIISCGILIAMTVLIALTVGIYALINTKTAAASIMTITTTTATTATTTTATTATTSTTTTTITTTTTASTTTVFYSYIFKATTTTARPTVNITQAGDPIVGICNTIAGGNVGGSGVNYPITENISNAIDGSLSTKYLNFGSSSSGCSGSSPAGINTGFYVTPTRSNASIAVGLLFATANDSPNRDPITVTLEGTNATTTAAFNSGTSWTLIYNGSTGISSSTDPGRQIYVSQQIFSNTIAFRSYRLLVTSKRGTDNSVQYAEAHIVGYI